MLQQLFGVFDSGLRKYQRIRDVGSPLMTKIAGGLPKDLIIRAGEDLGFVKDGRMFVLEDASDFDFVLDRAIHDLLWKGKRWIEHVCDEDLGKYQPEEQALLKANRESVFSLYEVMNVRFGRGMRLRDIFSAQELFLTDFGFGATGSKGLFMAARVISHNGIHFTSGVTMIYRRERVGQMIERLLPLYRKHADTLVWNETMRNQVPAFFQEYRQGDMRVELTSVTHASADPLRTKNENAGEVRQAPGAERLSTGRNAPCPCGSGRKYKKCCLGKERLKRGKSFL